MYRSSLTLAFVVLYSAAGAASDLSSVYVAPGGILRAFRRRLCSSGTSLSATALRGARLRISAALLWDAGPGISCTGFSPWRVRSGLRPAADLCRTRTRLSRSLLRSRALLRSGALLRRGTRLCAGICAEAAPARALSWAGAMRRRLWQVGLLRLTAASRGFVMIAMTVRRLGGAQRHPSPLRARDGWVLLSLYPSCVLSP